MPKSLELGEAIENQILPDAHPSRLFGDETHLLAKYW